LNIHTSTPQPRTGLHGWGVRAEVVGGAKDRMKDNEKMIKMKVECVFYVFFKFQPAYLAKKIKENRGRNKGSKDKKQKRKGKCTVHFIVFSQNK
jgi:hypothetical protein